MISTHAGEMARVIAQHVTRFEVVDGDPKDDPRQT
jgi:hypothetical protein